MRIGPLVALAALAVVGAAGWHWLQAVQPSRDPAPGGGGQGRRAMQRSSGPVPVTIDTVKKETVPVYREGIGNVQALFTVTVRSQIDGRLSSVDFVEGQLVKKGDVLARIDPVVYKALYDQAIAKKAQDEATLANARMDLVRYQKLALSKAGPQQQADQQVAMVAQLEAQVKSDDAAIANAKAFLDYTVIMSPLDGRAGLRQIDPGNIIHAADANGLVSIAQVMPIATIFTLPQRDLPVIATALARGNVAVEILDAGGKKMAAAGTLQTIDNQIDVSTGTIKLKATFPNTDQKLWPGQFVSTRVVIDTLVDAKVVPTPAVRRGPAGTFIYTVDADNKAVVRNVTVRFQDENRAVIDAGVDLGDRVVTVGFAQLANGADVKITNGDQAAPSASGKPAGAETKAGEAPDAAQASSSAPSQKGDGNDRGKGNRAERVKGERGEGKGERGDSERKRGKRQVAE